MPIPELVGHLSRQQRVLVMPSFEVSVLERCPYREVRLYMGMLIKCYIMYLGVGQNTDPQSMDYPYGLP